MKKLGGALDSNTDWKFRYKRRVAIVDFIVIAWAVSGTLIVRFGSSGEGPILKPSGEPYVIVSLILALSWWIALYVGGSRDMKVLGHGSEEYKRLVNSSLGLFGVIAIVSYSFQLETARGYIGLALPCGVLALTMARWAIRRVLRYERTGGRSVSRVLIVGSAPSAEHLVKSLQSQPMAGYLPIGVYLPGASEHSKLGSELRIPIMGRGASLDALLKCIEDVRPEAVALSNGVNMPPSAIRELGWVLAEKNISMIMAPALTDVAGPRIHTQPVAGLPLIHVSTPNLRAGQQVAKRLFDVSAASVLIVLLIPVFIVVSVLVKTDTPGPVLFRQIRVGYRGNHFNMYKFRSMIVDAERHLEDLRLVNQGNGVLFKLKTDPRVTKVGGVLRRFSVDELPQLFNVLNGTMSLVGPRPPLPTEVEQYESHVKRRLLVRPGLTGLWQVSGRSLLSWEDTVRLDLYYVENWSLVADIAILLRTFRAVVSKHGAY